MLLSDSLPAVLPKSTESRTYLRTTALTVKPSTSVAASVLTSGGSSGRSNSGQCRSRAVREAWPGGRYGSSSQPQPLKCRNRSQSSQSSQACLLRLSKPLTTHHVFQSSDARPQLTLTAWHSRAYCCTQWADSASHSLVASASASRNFSAGLSGRQRVTARRASCALRPARGSFRKASTLPSCCSERLCGSSSATWVKGGCFLPPAAFFFSSSASALISSVSLL